MSQRLTSAKESSSKPALQSHEDLARKLQVTDWDIKPFVSVLFLSPMESYNSFSYLGNLFHGGECLGRRSWREIERHQVMHSEFNFESLNWRIVKLLYRF